MNASTHDPKSFGRAVLCALFAVTAASHLTGCTPVVCTGTTDVPGTSGREPANCLGFRTAAEPVLDGVIFSDPAWVNSFRFVLGDGNGTSVPHGAVQGLRTADALYLSFEVNNDPTFDKDDAIVLGFDPDGDTAVDPATDAANHRRIHIFPLFTGSGADPSGAPQGYEYWKGSADANWSNSGLAPDAKKPDLAWLGIKVKSQNSGTSKHWQVEVKIPIVAGPGDAGIDLPDGEDFGFYFSVIVVKTDMLGATSRIAEFSWPLGVDVGTFIEETPVANLWGNGIFGFTQNGVTISSGDITTDQTPPTHIDLDEPNVFRANVKNFMVNAAGTPVVARNVRASFRIRNFGISSPDPNLAEWALIPTGGNPTPLHDVPAGVTTPDGLTPGAHLFQTAAWTVQAALRPHYAANPSQCVRVDLESTGPDTLIVNRSAMSNMKFVDTSSPFPESAVVAADGEPPPGERELDILLREFRYNTQAAAPWTTQLAGAQPVGERLWRLRTPPGPDARLDTVITPPPIALAVERFTVPAGAPDAALRIPVQPGNLVTLVAEGSIVRDGVEIGPNGTDPRLRPAPVTEGYAAAAAVSGDEGAASSGKGRWKRWCERWRGRHHRREQFPLPASAAPEQRVGALVGSFDGFARSAFVVGRSTTLVVPAGAQTLALATNDTAEGWERQEGDGFAVEVIQTPRDDAFFFTGARLPLEPPRDIVFLPLGQNLPTWLLCGERRTGSTLTIHGVAYERYADAGCYGYVVKSIGRDGGTTVGSTP